MPLPKPENDPIFMKNRILIYCRLALAVVLLGSAISSVTAQTTKKKGPGADQNGVKGQASTAGSGVRVKIIERTTNGEVNEVERTYPIDEANDGEREKLVNQLVDSLRTRRLDKKAQITIIVEDINSNQNRLEMHQFNSKDFPGNLPRSRSKDLYSRRNDPYQFRYYKDGKLQNEYSFNPDSLADRLNRLEFKFPQNFTERMDDAFRNWSWSFDEHGAKSPSIHNLQVYPNNPATNELNIRFSAPTKGDVHIRVTTPDGKEIARKEVKDFSGNYTGQIDFGRKAQGVCFVNVTQNEDGAVKRVVLP